MKVYRSDGNVEQKVAKYIERPDGLEVHSNDGTMRIILQKVNTYIQNLERAFYSTTYYIKEDTGWIKTKETQSYNSERDFIVALKAVDEFSEAIEEYRVLHSNNR